MFDKRLNISRRQEADSHVGHGQARDGSEAIADNNPSDFQAMHRQPTVERKRQAGIRRMGQNIKVAKFLRLQYSSGASQSRGSGPRKSHLGKDRKSTRLNSSH